MSDFKKSPQYKPKGLLQTLDVLTEELGEVLQALGKTRRWGPDSYNPELSPEDRVTNRTWLLSELKDLEQAIALARQELEGAKKPPGHEQAKQEDRTETPAGKATAVKLADWSLYPYGRYRQDGEHSAEAFRDDYLIPALETHELVEVDLAGPIVISSTWLEECFGGLVRAGYSAKELEARLTVVGGVKSDHLLAKQFIEEADK